MLPIDKKSTLSRKKIQTYFFSWSVSVWLISDSKSCPYYRGAPFFLPGFVGSCLTSPCEISGMTRPTSRQGNKVRHSLWDFYMHRSPWYSDALARVSQTILAEFWLSPMYGLTESQQSPHCERSASGNDRPELQDCPSLGHNPQLRSQADTSDQRASIRLYSSQNKRAGCRSPSPKGPSDQCRQKSPFPFQDLPLPPCCWD